MALDAQIAGLTGTKAEVDVNNALKTNLPTDSDLSGYAVALAENDAGNLTGIKKLTTAEVDSDFRVRVAPDLILDEEVFNYTAQNTGKHYLLATTMANTWTAGQLTTNSGSITTTTTGTAIATYAFFPTCGTQTLSADFEAGFSAQPTTNSFIEFGVGIAGSSATIAPTDGVFFRLSSAGLMGVASSNGTETTTGVFPLANGTGTWVYTNSKRYQFIVYANTTSAQFWVDDGTGVVLMGEIPLPTAQGRMCMAAGVQLFIKHRITGGAAGGVLQGLFGAYNVRVGGSNITSTASTHGNRLFGSYQGLSGGTMGTLARIGTITTGNEANVTAAVPTTTTAALGSGLGGTFWETATLAANTDGIIMSYQVPAGTVNVRGRRLVLRGLYLNSYIQTALTGGPFTAEWFLAFGHTAVSLGTAEGTATKAPRRIVLPFVQHWTSGQAVNTGPTQSVNFFDLGDAPVFVNPGEFIQLCTRHIGTAPSAGTIVHRVTPVYGWE